MQKGTLWWKRAGITALAVCLFALGRYLWTWWGPTPYAVAWKFARAWERGDVNRLYALLDNVPPEVIGAESRRRPPQEGFERLMREHIFPIAPPGTRWRFVVSDRHYMVFRFTTAQGHWMAVPIRRSLDGRWRVSGMDALRTLYTDALSRSDPRAAKSVEERFRRLWTAAWTHVAEAKQS
ncbi:MAG: hypothetical protein NZT92_15355 [Abditibacteriales bacterium]|nr:hypothetical protein [Abditibacteriales bacterium]